MNIPLYGLNCALFSENQYLDTKCEGTYYAYGHMAYRCWLYLLNVQVVTFVTVLLIQLFWQETIFYFIKPSGFPVQGDGGGQVQVHNKLRIKRVFLGKTSIYRTQQDILSGSPILAKTDQQTDTPTDWQSNRPTDRQTNRQTDQQIDRPTDRQTNQHIDAPSRA